MVNRFCDISFLDAKQPIVVSKITRAPNVVHGRAQMLVSYLADQVPHELAFQSCHGIRR